MDNKTVLSDNYFKNAIPRREQWPTPGQIREYEQSFGIKYNPMSLPTEQHFILKENGLIHWIEKMPENHNCIHRPRYLFDNDADYESHYKGFMHFENKYKTDLQSAIDSAVEVANQKIVHGELFDKYDCNLEPGKVYSLLCSVEKKPVYTTGRYLALVTFSQPEKETQEELETAHWVRIINDARFYDGSPHDMIKLIGHFKKLGYTITRKK